ncbi:MAG TPA: arginine--tRNA ligase [Fimbriimonadaceae bacterium]|nr:arginine--tRNA ligase [Fimbriimonadaceae bacterium]
MLREDLGHLVTSAIDHLIQTGALPEPARGPVEIIDTKQPEHGDYATNFALTAAKRAGMNPRDLATGLAEALATPSPAWSVTGRAEGKGPNPEPPTPNPQLSILNTQHSTLNTQHPTPNTQHLIQSVDIAGPGFLNFRLNPEAVAAYVPKVLNLGEDLPKAQGPNAPTPQKINVEFVSVNPNGPITVGSGRGAAFGDTLCRVLEASGHSVYREYYVNDGVNSEQMRLFAESVRHYYHNAVGVESAFPEKGYRGDYVQDVARRVHELYGEGHDRDETGWFQARSQDLMLERQREDLHTFGVDFDIWFSEQSLHNSGEVAKRVDELIAKHAADEKPERTVLKMARGGVIESVEKQPQTQAMEDEDVTEATPDASPSESPNAQRQTPNTGSGATLWLRSTKFGDDMDRVLRRRDGRLTYIASDVAYHKDKLTDNSGVRGTGPVDKLITILGPDHHGYIARLQAVLAAMLELPLFPPGEREGSLGDQGEGAPATCFDPTSTPPGAGGEGLDEIESQIFESVQERDACKAALDEARRRLEVVIFQIVRFMKDGKPSPMRKRDGNIYELRDLISEVGQTVAANATKKEQQRVGADVARFFYLMRSHDTALDFDIDLATKQSDDNPVFYVQYAHARICSVIRKAEAAGLGKEEASNTSLLTHSREQALVKKILDLPLEVRRAAEDYGVHRIATYAIELARTYHHFYDACRVIQPEAPELSQARLALCEAARIALKASLDLLGISAPERMDREIGTAEFIPPPLTN